MALDLQESVRKLHDEILRIKGFEIPTQDQAKQNGVIDIARGGCWRGGVRGCGSAEGGDPDKKKDGRKSS